MPCILNIETSTTVCSVSLSANNQVFFCKENRENMSHASCLGVFIAEAISFIRKKGLMLDAVAVSSGPGSYTGLRIGVSEAKGLCFGLDIPLISVSSLDIMASEVIGKGYEADYYCPMIDARRMEVYAAVYDKDMRIIRSVGADIVDKDTYSSFLNGKKMLFFGNGAEKCMPVIDSPQAKYIEGIVPLASSMVPLSEKAFEEKRFEDVAYFEPFYLKEFIATIAKNKVINKN